ncbi:hypothetical protein Syncc8109_1581 [Synechococcus sp. WH 8109]|nr:hypothetical protein Syncc8109_1581 [Synechococcus sp. WH 8109]
MDGSGIDQRERLGASHIMQLRGGNGRHRHRDEEMNSVVRKLNRFMASDTAVRWPAFLPLVLFFGGIGAAAAMTQLLG